MGRQELRIGKNKIAIYGSNNGIEEASRFLHGTSLYGDESIDRLIIQEGIDRHRLKAEILYDGNHVIPFASTVKAYEKLKASGSLLNLTDQMYDFFIYQCGDIAHYNKMGFIDYYDGSFQKLQNELIPYTRAPAWKTDARRVFREIGIGHENAFDAHQILNGGQNNLQPMILEGSFRKSELQR